MRSFFAIPMKILYQIPNAHETKHRTYGAKDVEDDMHIFLLEDVPYATQGAYASAYDKIDFCDMWDRHPVEDENCNGESADYKVEYKGEVVKFFNA